MAVNPKPGDVVFAKGVAAFGTCGSLEFDVPRKEMYCCLLLGKSHDSALPRPPEHGRLALRAGVVSLDDVREILGEDLAAKLLMKLDQKYQPKKV